jgi:hypothetical protein
VPKARLNRLDCSLAQSLNGEKIDWLKEVKLDLDCEMDWTIQTSYGDV